MHKYLLFYSTVLNLVHPHHNREVNSCVTLTRSLQYKTAFLMFILQKLGKVLTHEMNYIMPFANYVSPNLG